VANFVRIEQMRTRIARDLHDDIGSGLSKIVILSEVAQRPGTKSPTDALDRIAETSREVLNAVGDLVWATNATTERMEDLVRRMRSFATQLFEAQNVEFDLEAIDVPLQKTLSPEVLRQLHLIFKEAVNNAARHSQCTHARGVLQFAHGTLTMRIIDNGVGFPEGMPGPRSDHHGLESLKARARTLGGTIEWRREQGTLVELIVPLRD
jgi:signal transduction histidine kinase